MLVCLKLSKVFSGFYPRVWPEFKHLIPTIRTSVIDKIVCYSIYALIKSYW